MKLKISQKLIIIFSITMLAVISTFYVISSNMLLQNSTESDNTRFRNMGAIIISAIEQQISMMDIAAEELLDNVGFMSALNQYMSDDTSDSTAAYTARSALLQQLYNSPMVDSFYRVTFYTKEGEFISSRIQKDDYLESGTPQAREVISSLPWLADETAASRRQVLPMHTDFLYARRDVSVYGIVRPVVYRGKTLGYLEVSNEKSAMTEIVADAADSDVLIQAVFDNGTIFYSNSNEHYSYPADMPMHTMVDYIDEETGVHHHVMCVRSNWLGLTLYLAQDYSVVAAQRNSILLETAKVALFIMLPTFAVIIIVSRALTHSALLLKKKVRSFPLDHVLEMPAETIDSLHTTVSAPFNAEIYELEQSFNRMMLRLQESIHNEMTLHESTLQARLKALQMQINPHFIYNTLNIISAHSVESENWEICEICDQFAQLLRYSTDSHSETATLAAEIDNARNYLQLAKARYEEDLEYTINVPGNLHELTIPKLTLQPIIENALNHGFSGTDTRRCLSITGTVQENNLILEIRDNGAGFAPEVLERLQADIRDIERGNGKLLEAGNHIGLINTCLRLHYYSRGAMRISLRNDHGAVVRLTMPC